MKLNNSILFNHSLGLMNGYRRDLKSKPTTADVPTFMSPANVQLPQSVNWVKAGAVTPIKDQGPCGSCWTFGGCGYAESKLIISGLYDTSLDLAEQYLLECTRDSTCNGGYIEYVMEEISIH